MKRRCRRAGADAPQGSVVADSGDAGAFIDRMLAHLRDTRDILFVSATVAPLTAEFLRDLINDYHRNQNVPCAVSGYAKAGRRATRIFIADTSAIGVIEPIGASEAKAGRRATGAGLLQTGSSSSWIVGTQGITPETGLPAGRHHGPAGFCRRGACRPRTVALRLMDAGVTIIDPERTYVDWALRWVRAPRCLPIRTWRRDDRRRRLHDRAHRKDHRLRDRDGVTVRCAR